MDVIRSKNFIDVIEDSISRPLLRKELQKYPVTFLELEKLRVALNEFNRGYKLPIKKDTELRPAISPKLNTINNMGFNYVRRFQDYSQHVGEFTRTIKSYLLYCHGLVIEDPLIYLLDYFNINSASCNYALERMPAIQLLLLEYCDISDLIREEIIFPISEPRYPENEIPSPNEFIMQSLSQRLAEVPNDLSRIVRFIYREQFRKKNFENNVDIFFPSCNYAFILQELMKIQQEKFTRDEIIKPFATNVIGGFPLLNLDAISIKDICIMRKQDDVFSDWRFFLDLTFKDLYTHSAEYTDLDKEFLASVRSEFSNLQGKVNNRLSKSLSDFSWRGAGQALSLGFASGVISGAATGDLEKILTTSLLTGITLPTLQATVDLVKHQYHRKERRVIRNHFLALGLPPVPRS